MFLKLTHLTLLDRLCKWDTVCRLFDQVWQKKHQKMAETGNSRILRIIALLVPVCLVSIPAQAKYGGGSGEPHDPYQIATAADLIILGETPDDYDKHFILTADIDLDPNLQGRKVFDRAVIAPYRGTPFTGVLDGKDHTISHLTIVGEHLLGLFGTVDSGATICNLGLEAVNVNGIGDLVGGLAGHNGDGIITSSYSTGKVRGDYFVGGLVGSSGGSIATSYSTAAVTGTRACTGGLVGYNHQDITASYSTGTVTGEREVGGLVGNNDGSITTSYSAGAVIGVDMVGGLVGRSRAGTITSCFSAGNVTGERDVGGLVGSNGMNWGSSKIIDCYSLGSVTGTDRVGGLVGSNDQMCIIATSYSAGYVVGNENVGGLVGANNLHGGGVVQDNCLWDIETSGQTTSDGGTGRTTAKMQTASTFVGWGCDLVWTIDEGVDYPRLVWEDLPGEIVANPSYGGGSGTHDDPYLIYTAEHLQMIGLILCDCDKHFRLMADIDLSAYDGTSFNIIGRYPEYPFVGVFDGQGHTISNFTYASTGTDHIGLFGRVGYYEGEDGAIENLGLLNPRIDAGTGRYVGSLVGWNSSGTITNCYVAGGSVAGDDCIGGLVGGSPGPITNCASSASVAGDVRVGGLAGWVSTLKNSYAAGTVFGNEFVGGLVGSCRAITTCYSAGHVTGTTNVGGLMGSCWESTANSFWDMETSDLPNMCGIQGDDAVGCDDSYGKTTAEMKQQSTFKDWDFINVWGIGENQTYPYLRTVPAGDINKDRIVNFLDLCIICEQWMDEE